MQKLALLIVGLMTFGFVFHSSSFGDSLRGDLQSYSHSTITQGRLVEDMINGKKNTSSRNFINSGLYSSTSGSNVLEPLYAANKALQPILDGIESVVNALTPRGKDTSDL